MEQGKKKTYKLVGTVTVSIYTEVEANTLEEAIQIAQDRSIEKSQYKDTRFDEFWLNDEYDGEVSNIKEG